MTRTLFGVLVAAAASGSFALVPNVASAGGTTVAVASTVTLAAFTSPVAHGSETQTFSGTVTGKPHDGFPTGTVKVETTHGTPICTGTLGTDSSTDEASFSCMSSATALAGSHTYAVEAHYTGGPSTLSTFSYDPSTSLTRSLRVTTPEPPTVTLSTVHSPVARGYEQQTISGAIVGRATDGYPATGTLVVETTTTHTVLCRATMTAPNGVRVGFTCSITTPTELAAGTYTVYAHYTGGSSSSSTYNYDAATSNTKSLDVVTPTSETPVVSLNAFSSPVSFGSEDQTFSGTVKGVTGDGYPTGLVTVKASTHVLCSATLARAGASTTTSDFSCSVTSPSLLTAGTYSVHAHYAGGVSSNAHYKYATKTSSARTLTVTNGIATSTTLTLNHTSRLLGEETQEVFTITVTGRAGDGYPKGTVTVKTTGGTPVCSSASRTGGTTDSSKFACSPGASALPGGTYKVAATYTPTATHSSSTTGETYASSVSARKTFKVTGGVATTSSLALNASSRASGAETAEIFTVTVTGKTNDGYPKGTVKVKTSSGTALCTVSSSPNHTSDASTFACSPHASALSQGTYTVYATFTPAATSSSTTSVTYAASTSNSVSFTVGVPTATRIYGATPDATAAQELESVYPGSKGTCPGTTSNRPVVLANDAHFPDALAASYLAKWLGTGMLLTPTSSLSSVTLTALEVEGITHVYVVGGSLAVSTAVVTQLKSTRVYDCRGATRTTSFMTVTRISGATQYTTAEDIAEKPGTGFVGSVDLQGAYGLYNDTTGKSSTAPSGSQRTAILANGTEFQDAEAAATVAYADDLPLLLTTPTSLSPQALDALTTLRITQVILMGGPLAVTNGVVTQLSAQHISVLRVAGVTDTDTSVQLADLELASTSGHLGLGWTPTGGVTVSRGNGFTDGLAGSVVAASGGATAGGPQPMLLTENPSTVGTPLTTFLKGAGVHGIDDDGTVVYSLTVLGGALAVTTSVVDAMEADL